MTHKMLTTASTGMTKLKRTPSASSTSYKYNKVERLLFELVLTHGKARKYNKV
jgi:hypothetical protein